MIPLNGATVPEWTVGDRMAKSLKSAGMGVQEMADFLGVSRNTVSGWLNGRFNPRKQTLMLWAMHTGVPYTWLTTGQTPPGGPDGVEVAGAGFEPATSGSQVQRLAVAA